MNKYLEEFEMADDIVKTNLEYVKPVVDKKLNEFINNNPKNLTVDFELICYVDDINDKYQNFVYNLKIYSREDKKEILNELKIESYILKMNYSNQREFFWIMYMYNIVPTLTDANFIFDKYKLICLEEHNNNLYSHAFTYGCI